MRRSPYFSFAPSRRLALSLVASLVWSFALAPVALAAAPQAQPASRAALGVFTDEQIRQALQRAGAGRQAAVTEATAPMDAVRGPAKTGPAKTAAPRPALTLLDEVGRLARPVSPAQAAAWRAELNTIPPAAPRAALLHLWLGEVALARDEQPGPARRHFRQAQAHSRPRDAVYGLAAYDAATALFYAGAYEDAALAFHGLLVPRTALYGYDHRACALWWRHARACAGYHAQHARIGIPEPPQLDPLCGVAAVAAGLRALKMPYAKPALLRACRVTGEGSRLSDLTAAGPGLGVTVRAITADDRGLRALPKPLVAYVERDHFVAVVRADAGGVSYLCSDCGPWPGGRGDLTWAQWHTLNPGIYATVTRPGSAWDGALAVLLGPAPSPSTPQSLPPKSPNALQVTMAGPLSRLALSPARVLLPALRGHVARFLMPTHSFCGTKPESLHCPPYYVCCWDCYEHALHGGPSDGDPVNLATGEEEYQPAPDITVYNPHGPGVTFQRMYNSLRNAAGTFGVGWATNYDVTISYNG